MRLFGGLFIVGMAAGCLAAPNSIPASSASEPTAPLLATPYQPYKLKLIPYFIPPSRPTGLLIKARIDGGPQLRLLLDSGAQYIVLDKKSAARSGHTTGEEMDLVGAGKTVRFASRTTAGVVDFGGLVFRSCPLVVVDGKLAEGIDGVIPLSLFGGFEVRLDVAGRTLDLRPYTEQHASEEAGFVKALAEHSLLFIPANIEGRHDGYVLLDTGSSYNVISNAAAVALKRSRALAPGVTVQAGAGTAEGRLLANGVSLQMGERTLLLDPVVTIDLSELCRRHGKTISGVMGHPALADAVLTVHYRDSMIRIAGARQQRASR